MNKQFIKYLSCSISLFVLMFVLIFVTAGLTGYRDIGEFNETDKIIFACFAVIEITLVILAFVFAGKAGKANPNAPHVKLSKQETVRIRRGALMFVTSFLIAFTAMGVGIRIRKNLPQQYDDYFLAVFAVCIIAPLLFIVVNKLLMIVIQRKFMHMKVAEMQQYIQSHRELAEKTSAKKLAHVKKIKILTDLYAILIGILAVGLALSAGEVFSSAFCMVFGFLSMFLLLAVLHRIRFAPPEVMFEENKVYVSANDYPNLYALARKAADTLSCGGRIRIAITRDCNAGIANIGGIYSVQLGVIMLSVMSEEEVYNILLHEFSHMQKNMGPSSKEGWYNEHITADRRKNYIKKIASLLFDFPDITYTLQFGLYLYASSILCESEADLAMARYGDAAAAASALLKLKYHDLYEWEEPTYDEPSFFEAEDPRKIYITMEIDAFKRAMERNAKKWNGLVDVEILARSASHPTLKMRLEALGVTDYKIIYPEEDGSFRDECNKALAFAEELLFTEYVVPTYEKDRKEYYLEPKEKVEAWENAGRPLSAEEYRDVRGALCWLGRRQEADELMQRAMRELPDLSNHFAYFAHGCFLLNSYDETGIEYIYHAIESNSNYIDEGLQTIGEFCCLMGKQDELEVYRQKAVEIAQNQSDKFSKGAFLDKKDNLSAEHLPEGMGEEILSYIRSVDKDVIDKIYVVRKTIADDYFTSAFVIKFAEGTEDETIDEIMHKIFSYLDTCNYDWHFSLFTYEEVAAVRVDKIENSCVYSRG